MSNLFYIQLLFATVSICIMYIYIHIFILTFKLYFFLNISYHNFCTEITSYDFQLAQKTKDALNTNIVEPAIKGMTAIGEYGKQTVASFSGYNQTKNSAGADTEKK